MKNVLKNKIIQVVIFHKTNGSIGFKLVGSQTKDCDINKAYSENNPWFYLESYEYGEVERNRYSSDFLISSYGDGQRVFIVNVFSCEYFDVQKVSGEGEISYTFKEYKE